MDEECDKVPIRKRGGRVSLKRHKPKVACFRKVEKESDIITEESFHVTGTFQEAAPENPGQEKRSCSSGVHRHTLAGDLRGGKD